MIHYNNELHVCVSSIIYMKFVVLIWNALHLLTVIACHAIHDTICVDQTAMMCVCVIHDYKI